MDDTTNPYKVIPYSIYKEQTVRQPLFKSMSLHQFKEIVHIGCTVRTLDVAWLLKQPDIQEKYIPQSGSYTLTHYGLPGKLIHSHRYLLGKRFIVKSFYFEAGHKIGVVVGDPKSPNQYTKKIPFWCLWEELPNEERKINTLSPCKIITDKDKKAEVVSSLRIEDEVSMKNLKLNRADLAAVTTVKVEEY